MSIAAVNQGSSEQGSASTTFVYTLPWSPAAGNTLIVAISGNDGNAGTTYSVADSTSTTYAQDFLRKETSSASQAEGFYRRENIPSGITTITITCSVSTFLTIAVLENANHLSSSLDVTAAGAQGNSVSAQPGSYTPTTGDAAYTTMTHSGSGTVTLTTATAGWAVRTKQESTAGMPICVLENLNSSGAQNPTTTLSVGNPWDDIGVSYKPSVVVPKDFISGAPVYLVRQRPSARTRAAVQLQPC